MRSDSIFSGDRIYEFADLGKFRDDGGTFLLKNIRVVFRGVFFSELTCYDHSMADVLPRAENSQILLST